MYFNYKKDFEITSEAAYTNIVQLTNQFQGLLEDNAMALAEIKALGDEDTIQKLKGIVVTSLEDADPDPIVNGMLEIDAEPYKDYLEGQSAKRNHTLSNKIYQKHEDRYKNELQEFFDDTTLKTNLGVYNFELDKLSHSTGIASSYTVNVHHDNIMKPQITVTSTQQKQRVEEDVIGLEDFSKDIEPNYFKLDSYNLTKDLATEYNQYISDDYIPFHHKPLTVNIAGLLGG